MISIDHTINRDGATYLTPEYVKFLFANDLLVDASAGGLIDGPSWDEGAIALVGCNERAEFFVSGYSESWNYLVNAFAARDYETELGRIQPTQANNETDALFRPYSIPEATTVLRVEPREINGELHTPILYFSTRTIFQVARCAAQQHLAFLEQINRQAWHTNMVETTQPDKFNPFAVVARHGPSVSDN